MSRRVDKFTKLPPGFTHELPQHLQQKNPALRLHPTTGVPVLNFDEMCCGAHGFSALIETQITGEEPHLTLFDTGPDFPKSSKQISRGSKCVVDCHPDRPISRGMARGPLYDTVFAALPDDPSFEEIATTGGVVEKHAEGHAVADGGVWVSGEIPRITPFEGGVPGGRRWVAERVRVRLSL
ncbi:hypothetical protein C8F01DRAFT_1103019 [Mycena amicta]|nr:hypothetical protein C8F01DRAFT_1103019 [Mycena amicta]